MSQLGPNDETTPLSPDEIRESRLASHPQPPQEFAGYQIQSELGRGGMGVVYKAFDPDLQRHVALKVLLNDIHASEEEQRRFVREVFMGADLPHRNIVPVHELKSFEGRFYYTMDFIDGKSFDQLLKEKSLTLREGLELIENVARAIGHAHLKGKGVVHRDLKPANILLSADGEPKIIDFGLAKITNPEWIDSIPDSAPQVIKEAFAGSELTRSGSAMGTPYYMAPEQAAGQSRNVDARTDVYALGCIIYELATGIPPFVAASDFEILRKHVDEDPAPPSQRVKKVKIPSDVDAICLKCLEKAPERRYQTAGELAEDLRRYLDGEAVSAAAATTGYRVRKGAARGLRGIAKWLTAVAAALVLLMTFGILHEYGMRQALLGAKSAQRDLRRERAWAMKLQGRAEEAAARVTWERITEIADRRMTTDQAVDVLFRLRQFEGEYGRTRLAVAKRPDIERYRAQYSLALEAEVTRKDIEAILNWAMKHWKENPEDYAGAKARLQTVLDNAQKHPDLKKRTEDAIRQVDAAQKKAGGIK